jgi:energy-coupling factor transporter ATP-binding protein EcfA2
MDYFIITAGATGSGKTSLDNSRLRVLGLPEDSEYTKILIDDLVENSESYKTSVRKIIETVQKCKKKQLMTKTIVLKMHLKIKQKNYLESLILLIKLYTL